ncbi:hypothetical protein [Streptomyces sp. E-15]
MTSSPIRGRPRRATAHIRVRLTHAVLGVLAGAGWLVLPVMTAEARDPVPAAPFGPTASAAAPRQDGTSATDLALPLAAGAAALALAGYGCVRRTRRTHSRTTPGSAPAPRPATGPADAERQARAALRLADDCVRTSREELSFVRDRFGELRTEPFGRALRTAETELAAAFALWRRYEDGVPGEAGALLRAPAGVTGRCAEAGRRLDAEAAALDRLRGFAADGPETDGDRGGNGYGYGSASAEGGVGAALEVAERRFRDLTARAGTARSTLAALRRSHPPSATAYVTGYAEQATDRLVFATARLNAARRAVDTGDSREAVRQLRAGEGAVAQAGVLVGGVEGLAARLGEAAGLLPAALAGAEAERAAAERDPGRHSSPGAERTLAAVRAELDGGAYDPLDVLRRITRASGRDAGTGAGVLDTAALLVARASVAAAEEFVAVHRGAVGAPARARLAQAVRELDAGHAGRADTAAGEARELAGRDVRAHGTAYADGDPAGTAGAVLAGILLAESADDGVPPAYGGPRTRSRHHP